MTTPTVKPVRLQLSRRRGFNLQALSLATNNLPAVNCARPSRFGNPHYVGLCPVCDVTHTQDEAVAEFAAGIIEAAQVAEIRRVLGGRNLGCFCELSDACHVDVLLAISNDCAHAH